jgi:hypothetical protein
MRVVRDLAGLLPARGALKVGGTIGRRPVTSSPRQDGSAACGGWRRDTQAVSLATMRQKIAQLANG